MTAERRPPMNASAPVVVARGTARVRWIPRQHGASAMLAVPFLLGVAVGRPSPWQALLLVAAVSGYLASTAALDWIRARRRACLEPAAVFGAIFAASGLISLAAFPRLILVVVVAGAAAAVAGWAAMTGRPRSLPASLAQAAEALMLVPAAAIVAGVGDGPTIARATLVAGLYLVSSVLVIRSMIRERGNGRFVAASIGYHVAVVAVEAWLLPWIYAALAVALAVRAAVLPALQLRLADGPHRLRPIHLGLVEIAASTALVLAAFMVRF